MTTLDTIGPWGTVIADPPWNYAKTSGHHKLKGYSDTEYSPLTTEDLKRLRVGERCSDNSVLLLWTTWPFLKDAIEVAEAWGFEMVTGLPWVKVTRTDPSKPIYGVGYWLRGCSEPLLVCKRRGATSTRTPYIGLLSEGLKHSRKPSSVYELADALSVDSRGQARGAKVELFARREVPGWTALGDEAPHDGQDIRDTLS